MGRKKVAANKGNGGRKGTERGGKANRKKGRKLKPFGAADVAIGQAACGLLDAEKVLICINVCLAKLTAMGEKIGKNAVSKKVARNKAGKVYFVIPLHLRRSKSVGKGVIAIGIDVQSPCTVAASDLVAELVGDEKDFGNGQAAERQKPLHCRYGCLAANGEKLRAELQKYLIARLCEQLDCTVVGRSIRRKTGAIYA